MCLSNIDVMALINLSPDTICVNCEHRFPLQFHSAEDLIIIVQFFMAVCVSQEKHPTSSKRTRRRSQIPLKIMVA